MRLLFVADGRSPIALNWMRYFVEREHQVHLASTYPCTPDLALASLTVIPVAFGASADAGGAPSGGKGGWLRQAVPVGMRTALRQWLAPLYLPRAARALSDLARHLQPDLVHAMRIPYEGMLAAMAEMPFPLLVSVWGNDFTLHAPANPWMGRLTRQALARTDSLHADCKRDVRLALSWGFESNKPSVVLPGGGGVQRDLFYPGDTQRPGWVINPRGMRAYLRNDTYFKAVPRVLARLPEAHFLSPAMAGERKAEGWVNRLGIRHAVELLPRQERSRMATLFRQAQVAVSPSTHDGTPNTLLEAMASGCFPIAGDLESLREWIVPGENGLLVDPRDPQALADAILTALQDPGLRHRAQTHNTRLIAERAEYGRVMAKAEKFYQELRGVSQSI